MKCAEPFPRLKGSKFKRNISLDEKEKQIYHFYGEDVLFLHAMKIVEEGLANPLEFNDSHQSPLTGHPIFKAMQATGTCCRSCLFKWHGIPQYRHLELHEIDFIVNMMMTWIRSSAF